MVTMSCWQLRSRLAAYVDDELPVDERRLVEAHLRRCAGCRGRISRGQAVRRQLQHLSPDLRHEGFPQPPIAGPLPTLRMAGLSLAGLVLVAGGWYIAAPRSPGAFAAEGQITDSRCASGHTHTSPALSASSGGECVRRCVAMGAEYVFVADGVVYTIRNQDLADLSRLAGRIVRLEGALRAQQLTVSSLRPLVAGRRPLSKGARES